MTNLTVLETAEGAIASFISERLRSFKTMGHGNYCLSVGGKSSIQSGLTPDLVIVSTKEAKKNTSLPRGQCGVLLLPGSAPAPTSNLRAGCVVSYGMSPKDSVTLSSIEKGSVMLSLQRELPTLGGGVLERQEIPVTCSDRTSPDDVMASATALLMLGVPPEDLSWA